MIELKKDDLLVVSIVPLNGGGGIRAHFARWGKNKKSVFCFQKGLDSTRTAVTVEWDNFEKVDKHD